MATLTSAPAIGYLNRASGRTITATTSATGYPASNLANARMSSAWRSTSGSLTSQRLAADLGSALDIDVIALLGFNGEDDATVTTKTSENSDLSSHEYSSGSVNAFDTTLAATLSDTPVWGRHLIHFPGTTKNSRYAGFDTLNDSGNPDNYLKGSVMWVGPVWQPPTGMMVESEALHVFIGAPGVERFLRGWKMVLRGLSEAESRALISIFNNKMRTGRLLFVPHPTDTPTFLHEAIYCTLVSFSRQMMPYSAINNPTRSYCWEFTAEFLEVED